MRAESPSDQAADLHGVARGRCRPRALASTLRLRTLRLCLDEPMTKSTGLAARLDRRPPTGCPYSVFFALHEDVTRQTPPRSAAIGSIDAALSDG